MIPSVIFNANSPGFVNVEVLAARPVTDVRFILKTLLANIGAPHSRYIAELKCIRSIYFFCFI
jgi:hypothetical protein